MGLLIGGTTIKPGNPHLFQVVSDLVETSTVHTAEERRTPLSGIARSLLLFTIVSFSQYSYIAEAHEIKLNRQSIPSVATTSLSDSGPKVIDRPEPPRSFSFALVSNPITTSVVVPVLTFELSPCWFSDFSFKKSTNHATGKLKLEETNDRCGHSIFRTAAVSFSQVGIPIPSSGLVGQTTVLGVRTFVYDGVPSDTLTHWFDQKKRLVENYRNGQVPKAEIISYSNFILAMQKKLYGAKLTEASKLNSYRIKEKKYLETRSEYFSKLLKDSTPVNYGELNDWVNNDSAVILRGDYVQKLKGRFGGFRLEKEEQAEIEGIIIQKNLVIEDVKQTYQDADLDEVVKSEQENIALLERILALHKMASSMKIQNVGFKLEVSGGKAINYQKEGHIGIPKSGLAFMPGYRYESDDQEILIDTVGLIRWTWRASETTDVGILLVGQWRTVSLFSEAVLRSPRALLPLPLLNAFKKNTLERTHRIVGGLEYQISEDIFLISSFGKNFYSLRDPGNRWFSTIGIAFGRPEPLVETTLKDF